MNLFKKMRDFQSGSSVKHLIIVSMLALIMGMNACKLNESSVSEDDETSSSSDTELTYDVEIDTSSLPSAMAEEDVDLTNGDLTTATITVKLTAPPESNIQFTASSAFGHFKINGSTAPASLIFKPGDYGTAQSLTIDIIDDNVIQDGLYTDQIKFAITSGDSNYRNLVVAPINLNISDNESPGLNINQSNNHTSIKEGANVDILKLRLISQPDHEVRVTTYIHGTSDYQMSLNPADDVTASSYTMVFDSSNWNIEQTLVLTALNDAVIDDAANALRNLAFDVLSTATGYADSEKVLQNSQYNSATNTFDVEGLDITDPDRINDGITVTIQDNDQVVYVNWEAPDGGDGGSWVTAYNNLDTALNNAITGQDLYITSGNYYASNSMGFSIQRNRLSLYGGFNGTETDPSERDVDNADPTVLSGDIGIDDSDTTVPENNNSDHVVYCKNRNNLVLDSLTIEKGYADGGGEEDLGGGIFNDCTDTTVYRLTVRYNHAEQEGGGLYSTNYAFSYDKTDPLDPVVRGLSESDFISNFAKQNGGGAYFDQSATFWATIVMHNNLFQANEAENGHGGAWATSGSIKKIDIEGGSYKDNVAGTDGGAIRFLSVSGTTNVIENVTFKNNRAAGAGGAIRQVNNAPITLTKTTFEQNQAVDAGGALRAASSVTLKDTNTFTQNSATGSTFGSGGALRASAITIEDTATFTNNSAALNGGALFCTGLVESKLASTLTLTNNSATEDGGAIHATNTKFLGNSVTANTNTARTGGAFYLSDQSAVMENMSLTNNSCNNTTDCEGGAIYIYLGRNGMGILSSTFTRSMNTANKGGFIFLRELVLDNTVTIAGNEFSGDGTSAVEFGGAIYAIHTQGTLTLAGNYHHDLVSSNQGGAVVYSGKTGRLVSRSETYENNQGKFGGAMYIEPFQADLNIEISQGRFVANVAANSGDDNAEGGAISVGGNQRIAAKNKDGANDIYATTGSLTIKGAIFEENSAEKNGGALAYNVHSTKDERSTLNISKSYFLQNSVTTNTLETSTDDTQGAGPNAETNHGGGGAISIDTIVCDLNGSSDTDACDTWNENMRINGSPDNVHYNLDISDTEFRENTSASDGGAVRIAANVAATIARNLFQENSAAYTGGGLAYRARKGNKFDEAPTIRNWNITDCYFIRNEATGGWGGGLHFGIGSRSNGQNSINRLLITRSVFDGNSAKRVGGVSLATQQRELNIQLGGDSSVRTKIHVTHSIFRHNKTTEEADYIPGGLLLATDDGDREWQINLQFNTFFRNEAKDGDYHNLSIDDGRRLNDDSCGTCSGLSFIGNAFMNNIGNGNVEGGVLHHSSYLTIASGNKFGNIAGNGKLGSWPGGENNVTTLSFSSILELLAPGVYDPTVTPVNFGNPIIHDTYTTSTYGLGLTLARTDFFGKYVYGNLASGKKATPGAIDRPSHGQWATRYLNDVYHIFDRSSSHALFKQANPSSTWNNFRVFDNSDGNQEVYDAAIGGHFDTIDNNTNDRISIAMSQNCDRNLLNHYRFKYGVGSVAATTTANWLVRGSYTNDTDGDGATDEKVSHANTCARLVVPNHKPGQSGIQAGDKITLYFVLDSAPVANQSSGQSAAIVLVGPTNSSGGASPFYNNQWKFNIVNLPSSETAAETSKIPVYEDDGKVYLRVNSEGSEMLEFPRAYAITLEAKQSFNAGAQLKFALQDEKAGFWLGRAPEVLTVQ